MSRKAVHIVGPVQLYQRGRYWHASYTTETGRVRESLKVTNLKVAEKKAREIAELIERGDYMTLRERRTQKHLAFAELAEEFRSKHKSWGESTWRGANGIIERLVAEWGHLPLTGINTRMIESFLARRLNMEGISNATANRHLACIKTLLKMGVRWGLLTHNPAEKVKMLKEKPKVPRALSEEESERLLAELPYHAWVLTVVALETGMRRTELFDLQWREVDFGRWLITVQYSKNNAFRLIPMTERVYRALSEQQQKGFMPYVLPSPTGGRIKSVDGALHEAGKRAGLGHVHLHIFRHTFATRLRERGVPLDRIMELLGHKGMTMTLRYAKTSPTQLREAIASLNKSSHHQEPQQNNQS